MAKQHVFNTAAQLAGRKSFKVFDPPSVYGLLC